MEVVKKNLASIIMGVVAILAVVSLFWPIAGLYDALHQEVLARVSQGTRLDALAHKQRSMPLLSPDQLVADPLTLFPVEKIIDAAHEATDQVGSQATAMLAAAVDANQHVLLLANELPTPTDEARYDFAKKYKAEMTGYARWKDILRFTSPPKKEDVDAEIAKRQESINEKLGIVAGGAAPLPDAVASATAQMAAEGPMQGPRLSMERAMKNGIYLLDGALPYDQNIAPESNNLMALQPDRICDAQIVMWVVDDVVSAVARSNQLYSDPMPGGAPADCLHAAVKQIVHVGMPFAQGGVSAGAVSAGGGNGAPVAPDPSTGVTSPTPKIVSVSPSGRVSNGLYDVLRVKVELVVDAEKIPEIIRELEVGQFITVLNFQELEVIDPAAAGMAGFRYGDKPVVRIELDCEELFLRDWLNKLLPPSRKLSLNGVMLGNTMATAPQPAYDSGGGYGAPGYPAGGFGGPGAYPAYPGQGGGYYGGNNDARRGPPPVEPGTLH